MSFIELFGGYWTAKEPVPPPEKMEKYAQVAKLMNHSHDYLAKIKEFFHKPGAVAKFYIKDNGDGTYTSGSDMGDLSHHTVFKLDGSESKVEGFVDGKTKKSINTFEGGVWTSRATEEGCLDFVCTFKIVGDELIQTNVVGDVSFENVLVRSTAWTEEMDALQSNCERTKTIKKEVVIGLNFGYLKLQSIYL